MSRKYGCSGASVGSYGLLQALVVVVASEWYFAYWFYKKMKIDAELTMMILSAVSICGVLAAIAIAGAMKCKQKNVPRIFTVVN